MGMKNSVKDTFYLQETKWRILDLSRGLLLSDNVIFLVSFAFQESLVQSVILFYFILSPFPLETKQNSTWIWHTTAVRHPMQLK